MSKRNPVKNRPAASRTKNRNYLKSLERRTLVKITVFSGRSFRGRLNSVTDNSVRIRIGAGFEDINLAAVASVEVCGPAKLLDFQVPVGKIEARWP